MAASVTIWSRLEPRSREFSMERSLQAQVRDPLWFLARQWQVGEFLGDDAGSPIVATITSESVPLTSYRAGGTGDAVDLTDDPPVEVQVERESIDLGLRAAVRLGLRFETLLARHGVGSRVDDFRAAYAIDVAAPPGEIADAAARRFRVLSAGRVVDGEQVLAEAGAHASDLAQVPPIQTFATAAERQAAADALADLVAERAAVYSDPAGDPSWDSQQLEYGFALGSESAAGSLTLEAPRFGGGHLDWYSFEVGRGALRPPAGTLPGADVRQQSFIPTNVAFRGMPNARWWNFEEGSTDFGKLDAERVDLAKLVVMEFALVYGDDWFELPLPLDVGSLTRVRALLVTDTFGERTVIRPTEQTTDGRGPRWSMFRLTGDIETPESLLLAPTLGIALDGPDVEDVLFLRDEMAAMAWGVERALQGPLDRPVDGYETYRERLAANPPTPRQRSDGGPEIEYVLGTDVPDNWIPMVPVQTTERSFLFRRGIMGTPDARGARGRILEPGTPSEPHPLYVAEEAIPRSGRQVTRRFRLARSTDGSTWLWVGRRGLVGRGSGLSGLAFDLVQHLASPSDGG